MLRAAICDDDPRDLARTESLLAAWCAGAQLEYRLLTYPCAESLLADPSAMDMDVIFMDVCLRGMIGTEAAARLQEDGYSGVFVFTTHSRAHVFESFLVSVLDYLVKPLEQERFALCMERLSRQLRPVLRSVTAVVAGKEVELPLRDIVFIETGQDHSTLIHLREGILCSPTLISAFAKSLAPYASFLRCHRSFIVNMNYIDRVEGQVIHMLDGHTALMAARTAAATRKRIAEATWRRRLS